MVTKRGKPKRNKMARQRPLPALIIASAFVVIGGIIVFIFLLSLICSRRDVIRGEAVDAAGEGNDDDHVIRERTGYMDAGAVDRKSVCGCGGPQGIREDSSELSVSCLNRVSSCGPNIISRLAVPIFCYSRKPNSSPHSAANSARANRFSMHGHIF